MLLALAGVTGVGKSFFVQQITEKLNFNNVHTIRTRNIRKGENPKYFMTEDELNKMNSDDKIAYMFKVFGGYYGYLKDEIFSENNMIFEMHYTTIYDWKQVRPDIKTIYILPNDINVAKQKTIDRHLAKEKEAERLAEIDEQYARINSDSDLHNQFDFFFVNNYDEASTQRLLNLVNKISNQS